MAGVLLGTFLIWAYRDTGASRGMAFVEVSSEADLHSALKLHHSVMGTTSESRTRTLSCSRALLTRKARTR